MIHMAETGFAPLAILASSTAWGVIKTIFSAANVVGTGILVADLVAGDAAAEESKRVAGQYGNDDEAIAKALGPLTDSARQYYLSVDFANWESAARTKYSGAAQTAALAGVAQAKQIVSQPHASLLDVQASAKALERLFAELDAQPAAAASGGAQSSSGAAPSLPFLPPSSSGTYRAPPAPSMPVAQGPPSAGPLPASAARGPHEGPSTGAIVAGVALLGLAVWIGRRYV